ncbi:TrkH family potassium uptake protein [Metaclostridioides mangenotii]|uniref:TrkH family potassium uptake protein n=1 Tax=Metaclostridioides mangenotii TaxID=1540 RepID=UPI0004BA62E2|nr:TrkH family potassium uptake protein [Clostridioides mangenotii]
MNKLVKRLLSLANKMKPVQIIVIGFASVILIGSLLLTLPITTQSGESVGFIDALFTATSCVCVTGLVVVDTGTTWNLFGQIICITLIQVGGLGFMTVATMFAIFTRKKINLKERLVIQESLNQFDLSGLVKLVRYVVLITFSIEIIGALILSTVFVPQFGVVKGAWFSVFHAISAFCNAGFDLMGSTSGEFTSITSYVNNATVSLTISILIICGGLGYPVMLNIAKERKFSKFNLHTKLVLISTVTLIFVGMALIFIIEYKNPDSIAPLGMKGKLLASLFQSVTSRTAGFSTLNLAAMDESSLFVIIILMFIGASPASTGGGIKTTTLAVLILTVKSFITGKSDIEVYERRIAPSVVKKSLGIFIVGISAAVTGTLLISMTQPGFNLTASAFEVVSALATVGSSLAGSANLNLFGKLLIILCMFMGRVGSLTIFMAVLSFGRKKNQPISYPDGKIIVG